MHYWRLADIAVARRPKPTFGALGILCHVWTAPSWQELSSRLQHWSVQPCVRPLSAARGPLAIMPCADQVPVNSSHSTMRWHKWVVLIAGSTGSALRAVRSPNFHITPEIRRDLVYAASATGCLKRSPLAIMAQTMRAILLASATATMVGRRANNAVSQRPMFGAMDLGITDDSERARHEQGRADSGHLAC